MLPLPEPWPENADRFLKLGGVSAMMLVSDPQEANCDIRDLRRFPDMKDFTSTREKADRLFLSKIILNVVLLILGTALVIFLLNRI